MAYESKPSHTARYEATVSTGLEAIAREEIIEKIGAKTTIQKGRILLETDANVGELLKLKSINNLFVIINDEVVQESEMPAGADQLKSLLIRVGNECDWCTGLSKWIEMSEFSKCSTDQILVKDENLRNIQPSFRVSSNRYGPKHKFTSPEICATFGAVVDSKFGWPIKMKNYDLEIYANFNENRLYIAITLTPTSLDCRNIISAGYTTLRAATCYAMLRVAKVELGDIVVDPMAGSGAIPIENMAAWKDREWHSFSLCSDLTGAILKKSAINMIAMQGVTGIPPSDLLISDVTNAAYRDNSVDVIVSDLPFGKRHGTKANNRSLYPNLMLDLSRIARLGTGRAVLLTKDFKSINLAYEKTKQFWEQKSCSFVKVGNLECWIYKYLRTDTPFEYI